MLKKFKKILIISLLALNLFGQHINATENEQSAEVQLFSEENIYNIILPFGLFSLLFFSSLKKSFFDSDIQGQFEGPEHPLLNQEELRIYANKNVSFR